jgi:hypothetical protein
VHIKWVDSANLFGDRWGKLEDIDDDETFCETMGFLVKENDHSVYVAGSVSPEEVGSVMQIPRVAIKELRDLETGEAYPGDSSRERPHLVPVPGVRED